MIKNVRFNWIRFGLIQNNHSERILTKWIYIRLCYKLRYPNRAIWGKRLWPHTPKIKTNLTGQISNVGSFCNERCLFMTKGGPVLGLGIQKQTLRWGFAIKRCIKNMFPERPVREQEKQDRGRGGNQAESHRGRPCPIPQGSSEVCYTSELSWPGVLASMHLHQSLVKSHPGQALWFFTIMGKVVLVAWGRASKKRSQMLGMKSKSKVGCVCRWRCEHGRKGPEGDQGGPPPPLATSASWMDDRLELEPSGPWGRTSHRQAWPMPQAWEANSNSSGKVGASAALDRSQNQGQNQNQTRDHKEIQISDSSFCVIGF